MKREWTYLAALLPYTTAISALTAFGAASDEWNSDAARHKSKASPDDEDSPEGQDGSGGQEGHGSSSARTPGEASASGDGGSPAGGGGHGSSDVGSSIAPAAQIAEGMFAPTSAGPMGGHMMLTNGGGGGGGGGFGVMTTTKTVLLNNIPTSPETPGGVPPDVPPDDGGIVTPDPADADAMMLLLGGVAEGTGEGAASSGDIVFDIVDYGSITFGYGYATFSSSGGEGSIADTFFAVQGADLVFSYETGPSFGETAFSTTHVLAIDFEDDTMFTEQQLAGFDWMQLLAEGPFGQNILGEEQDVSHDGNISLMNMFGEISNGGATPMMSGGIAFTWEDLGSAVSASINGHNTSLSVAGEAESIDSMASASGSLLEIEDHYSSVNGLAIGIG